MTNSSVTMDGITIGIQCWKCFWRKKTHLGNDPDVWIFQETLQPSLGAWDIRNCYLINLSEEISAAVKLNIQTQIKYISDTFLYQIFNRHEKLTVRSTYVFWEDVNLELVKDGRSSWERIICRISWWAGQTSLISLHEDAWLPFLRWRETDWCEKISQAPWIIPDPSVGSVKRCQEILFSATAPGWFPDQGCCLIPELAVLSQNPRMFQAGKT